MLVPRFTLCQDSKTVTIKLMARHCKLKDLAVEVIDDSFMFACFPYYLRLNLPGRLTDEGMQSSFSADTGEFTFICPKVLEGEVFQDLDFITKFLVKKVDGSYGFEEDDQKITVLCGDKMDGEEGAGISNTDLSYFLTYGFGFALQSGTHFKPLYTDYFDVFQVDPYKVKLQDRRKLRMQNEATKFNSDHYLADLIEPNEIKEIMQQVLPWESFSVSTLTFTDKELDFLKELKNKDYQLSAVQVNFVHNTLIDILFAYCYNQRTTYYDENPESGWNIVTLSASLSWLDVFDTPRETLVFAFRRSLIYPLYRHFELNLTVLDDLKKLINLGEKFIIKCLIGIYYILLKGDCCRYIINNLFIKDYVNYVMKWDKNKWQEYLEEFKKVTIKKCDLGLDLEGLEERLLLEPMENLELKDKDSDDTSTDNSVESEEDSSGVLSDTTDDNIEVDVGNSQQESTETAGKGVLDVNMHDVT